MSWIWQGALPFVVVLGTVILFHEYGHYLAAKWFGITVEVFSVGFGPRIAGFVRRGTEYRLAWIPLGGYVKLKGETGEAGGPLDPGDLAAHPRWQRFIVFAMGAVFNLITAAVLLTVVFMIGVREPAYLYEPPIVGEVDQESPAREADIRPGDRILSFGGEEVATWKQLQIKMMLSPGQTREVVLERDGRRVTTRVMVLAGTREIGRPGIFPVTGGVAVGGVQSGYPAEKAGLQKGDRLVSIDGLPMTNISRVLRTIQGAPATALQFVVDRGGEMVELTITTLDEDGRGRCGFSPVPIVEMVTRSYPLFEAMRQSLRQNLESAGLFFTTIRKLLVGEMSVRAFSGPVDIYRISGEAAQEGFVPFVNLIAFISLQLGIINLFPIPPLDGGHLFTIAIEGAIRRELSLRLKERALQAGLFLLLLLMVTILYFDISKNFFN